MLEKNCCLKEIYSVEKHGQKTDSQMPEAPSKETNTGDKLVRPSVLACHSFHHSVAFSIFLSFQNKLNLSV